MDVAGTKVWSRGWNEQLAVCGRGLKRELVDWGPVQDEGGEGRAKPTAGKGVHRNAIDRGRETESPFSRPERMATRMTLLTRAPFSPA